VLQSVPEERRATLLAEPMPEDGYRFDVHLQGEGETVFFAV
jgi:protocatechuate 3,4-dioxygenase alpha subunit